MNWPYRRNFLSSAFPYSFQPKKYSLNWIRTFLVHHVEQGLADISVDVAVEFVVFPCVAVAVADILFSMMTLRNKK